ncbi:SDR family NAD(P)-dependent oxidoreductase [Hydrogenophaga sp.]|jgi:NAD(P)-dependent dehydrogenase (short-subunit alcohol dehydrogenase family)|uniref:SDR family NAD(P)-dependent oxidoreductase n=1 Tax=Hydrogenophaga sp. TaxID=1904254 RepID=UPI0035B3AC8B
MRLKNKVALVLGAGSVGAGIGNGRAMAMLFAREGARVVAVDRDITSAQDTRERILAEGGHCEAEQADVSVAADVRRVVDACIAGFGRIDVLVNNVGIAELGGPVELSEEAWDRVFDVNVKSMFLACKHVLPHMERQGGGAIVNVSSLASVRWAGVPYVSYGASKAAVNGFSRYVAMQYARKNIRVNTILPGLINTPMIVEPLSKFYGGVSSMLAQRDAMCPTGSMGEAWDVAHAALYLASDDSKYVTGVELMVDGGLAQQVITPATI